ncbi:MAG: hypothetical protein ABTS22_03620 [Accumulibacter sp.]|uniref:hypothetical protein n=1 Tax=Accumulibacter sp. TaxID=2053492 RepID=UPI000558390C
MLSQEKLSKAIGKFRLACVHSQAVLLIHYTNTSTVSPKVLSGFPVPGYAIDARCANMNG